MASPTTSTEFASRRQERIFDQLAPGTVLRWREPSPLPSIDAHKNELELIKSAQILCKEDMDSLDAMVGFLDSERLLMTPGPDYFPRVAHELSTPILVVDGFVADTFWPPRPTSPAGSPEEVRHERVPSGSPFPLPSDEEILETYGPHPSIPSLMDLDGEDTLASRPSPLSRFQCRDGELFASVMARAVTDLDDSLYLATEEHLVQLAVLITWLMLRSKDLQYRGQTLTPRRDDEDGDSDDGEILSREITTGWQARAAFAEAIRTDDVDVIEDAIDRLEDAYLVVESKWWPVDLTGLDYASSDESQDDVVWDEDAYGEEAPSEDESWHEDQEDYMEEEMDGRVWDPMHNQENVMPAASRPMFRMVRRGNQQGNRQGHGRLYSRRGIQEMMGRGAIIVVGAYERSCGLYQAVVWTGVDASFRGEDTTRDDTS
ncbi:hypothetical protein ACRALDRAFT_1082931 [Sodiomyces alcalophilus JCM 7366]|uniref:uncharacterized protein n=1 Tax=Sodiomyces alcalophilus JCM 7366 TaxID=591952 RepID=UPI0039B68ABA